MISVEDLLHTRDIGQFRLMSLFVMTLYTDELLISVDSHHFIHDSLQIRVIDKCSLTLLSFMNIYTAILLNIIFSAGLRDYLLPSTDYNQVWAI